jgi:hypothetical protein
MSYRISGLDPAPFRHLYGLADEELARRQIRRVIPDSKPGFPDRIEMRDVEPGQPLLLLNYVHQPAATPYQASHAIFIREGAETRYEAVDEIPEVFRARMISLRAFDETGDMVDAGLAKGDEIEPAIVRLLSDPRVSYLHAHYATRGCYAGRIERA